MLPNLLPSDEHNDVPATKAAGRADFGPLVAGGVKIYEFEPTMFHVKSMVVDGVLSTIGSANFDERSFHLNEEINLVVYDAAFAGRARRLESRPYSYDIWKARPVSKRITEWLARPFRSEL